MNAFQPKYLIQLALYAAVLVNVVAGTPQGEESSTNFYTEMQIGRFFAAWAPDLDDIFQDRNVSNEVLAAHMRTAIKALDYDEKRMVLFLLLITPIQSTGGLLNVFWAFGEDLGAIANDLSQVSDEDLLSLNLLPEEVEIFRSKVRSAADAASAWRAQNLAWTAEKRETPPIPIYNDVNELEPNVRSLFGRIFLEWSRRTTKSRKLTIILGESSTQDHIDLHGEVNQLAPDEKFQLLYMLSLTPMRNSITNTDWLIEMFGAERKILRQNLARIDPGKLEDENFSPNQIHNLMEFLDHIVSKNSLDP